MSSNICSSAMLLPASSLEQGSIHVVAKCPATFPLNDILPFSWNSISEPMDIVKGSLPFIGEYILISVLVVVTTEFIAQYSLVLSTQ